MKQESKDQGHLIVVNGGGCNTPEVEMAWMGYTNGSCSGDEHGHGALPVQASGGEIKEGR